MRDCTEFCFFIKREIVMEGYNIFEVRVNLDFFGGIKKAFLLAILFIFSFIYAVESLTSSSLKSSSSKDSVPVDFSQPLKNFIEQLDLLAQKEFPTDGILELFRKNPLSMEDFKSYIFYKKEFYTRNLIHASKDYELLLLCWSPGQKSPVHGHEGQKCWMRVEQGSLEFTNYVDYQENGVQKFKITNKQVGTSGFVDGPAYIHGVANATSEPAISLHLYAKPFHQCDVFDVVQSKTKRVNLGFYSVEGKLVSSLVQR